MHIYEDDFVLWGQFDNDDLDIDIEHYETKKTKRRIRVVVSQSKPVAGVSKDTLVGCCINVIMRHDKLKRKYDKVVKCYTMPLATQAPAPPK
jgi:hypothetical protein